MYSSYENECRYCKHKFCWRYSCRNLNDIFAKIEKKIPLKEVESLTFMFDGKPWIIEEQGVPHEIIGKLFIELVEPLTIEESVKEAERRKIGYTVWTYHFPEKITKKRNIKLLQKVSKKDRKRDLAIVVKTLKNCCCSSSPKYYCGVTKTTGKKDIKIWLETV